MNPRRIKNNSLPWYIVEQKILSEMDWLRSSIETFTSEEKNGILDCKECLIRF